MLWSGLVLFEIKNNFQGKKLKTWSDEGNTLSIFKSFDQINCSFLIIFMHYLQRPATKQEKNESSFVEKCTHFSPCPMRQRKFDNNSKRKALLKSKGGPIIDIFN